MYRGFWIVVAGICLIFYSSCSGDKSSVDSENGDKKEIAGHSEAPVEEEHESDTVSVEMLDEEVVSIMKDADSKSMEQDLDLKSDKQTIKPESVKEKAKPIVKKKAKIEFEKTIYDFGEIVEGDVVEFDINFTNIGDGPLQILEANVTCGCTTPAVPFLDTEPGDSNKIGITYNSVNKSGEQNPQITLKTNSNPAYHVIKIKGFVKERTVAKDTLK